MLGLPIDGESFVYLNVLTGFHAAPAENALVRIVAVERICKVLLIGFRFELSNLMFHIQIGGRIVNGAVLVVVVANRAVEKVIFEDAVERFSLRDIHGVRFGLDTHATDQLSGARSGQPAIDLHHARVTGLDWAHLWVVTDLRQLLIKTIDQINSEFALVRDAGFPIQGDLNLWSRSFRRIEKPLLNGHHCVMYQGQFAVVWRIISSVTNNGATDEITVADHRSYDHILRVEPAHSTWTTEEVVVEEPLEIRLIYGAGQERKEKALSVTMRTPGHDAELVTGFLLTEGVVRDGSDIESVQSSAVSGRSDGSVLRNSLVVALAPNVQVNQPTLERNFYTTSSCGICGKASLLALQTICPPRRKNNFTMDAEIVRSLPDKLRARQGLFMKTGGLHGAALVSCTGELQLLREDVGRHNAVDKLIGAAAMSDDLPLRQSALLLSGRVSFELMQKAVMAGIPMVIAIGAPSTLAVEVAHNFDLTLIAFLRTDHFNVYNGASRVGATNA